MGGSSGLMIFRCKVQGVWGLRLPVFVCMMKLKGFGVCFSFQGKVRIGYWQELLDKPSITAGADDVCSRVQGSGMQGKLSSYQQLKLEVTSREGRPALRHAAARSYFKSQTLRGLKCNSVSTYIL